MNKSLKDVAKVAGGVYVGAKLAQPKQPKRYEDTLVGGISTANQDSLEIVGENWNIFFRIIGFIGVAILCSWLKLPIVLVIIGGIIGALAGPAIVMAATGFGVLGLIIWVLWWLLSLAN